VEAFGEDGTPLYHIEVISPSVVVDAEGLQEFFGEPTMVVTQPYIKVGWNGPRGFRALRQRLGARAGAWLDRVDPSVMNSAVLDWPGAVAVAQRSDMDPSECVAVPVSAFAGQAGSLVSVEAP